MGLTQLHRWRYGEEWPSGLRHWSFDRGEDGELFPAFGPADQQGEDRAIRTAKGLADKHVGVIAWSREANPDIGEYGPPTTLFASGDVPDIE